MRNKKRFAAILAVLMTASTLLSTACKKDDTKGNEEAELSPVVSYSFDETSGNTTKESVSGKEYKIEYVFNAENQASLLKPASDPLRKAGVSGKSLYMDGFSNAVTNKDFVMPRRAITLSAWVAPRVFENLAEYNDQSDAKGNPRLTSVINKGDIEMCEGFLLGYGRLGLWGVQIALENAEGEDFVAAFYDPLNALPLYEWSNIAVSFDSATGYIGLFYNGEVSYEAVIPELQGTRIISSEQPLYIGKYCSPMVEYGVKRQMISGLLDEVRVYAKSLSPKEAKENYGAFAKSRSIRRCMRGIGIARSITRFRPPCG